MNKPLYFCTNEPQFARVQAISDGIVRDMVEDWRGVIHPRRIGAYVFEEREDGWYRVASLNLHEEENP